MSDEPWDAYRWVTDEPLMDAYCIAVVAGAAVEPVIAAYGCDPASRRDVLFADQAGMSVPYPDGFGNDTVQIDVLDGHVVAIESNGWAAIEAPRPEVLSRSGVFVAVYENVNAVMEVVVAAGGSLLRRFDPLLYDAEGALAEEAGLGFGDPQAADASAFTLLDRLTGVHLARSWLLDQQHPAYTRDPSPPGVANPH